MGPMRAVVLCIVLLGCSASCLAQSVVTIPEFPEGYQAPRTDLPGPPGEHWAWPLVLAALAGGIALLGRCWDRIAFKAKLIAGGILAGALLIAWPAGLLDEVRWLIRGLGRSDAAAITALIIALAAATWFAVYRRSRRGVLAVMLLSLGYFGFMRLGCICSIGAIQNVAQSTFDTGYTLPIVAAVFFILPILATLLWGRTFCAAVCPLGAVQDVVGVKPLQVPSWLETGLAMFAWVYLSLAVLLAATGSAYIICQYDPFVAMFRITGSVQMLILGAALLVLGIFVARPYCRFICPLGAIFRLTSIFARRHVSITPDECIRCRLCEDSCPYSAIRAPSPDRTTKGRRKGKATLVALLALTPVLIVVAALIGRYVSTPLARLNPIVDLAWTVRHEDLTLTDPQTGKVPLEKITDASKAFRESTVTKKQMYAQAMDIKRTFDVGATIMGAFIGLVLAVKLVSVPLRRQRENFEPDRATCLSCGRCFDYCPVEHRQRAEAIAGELPPPEMATPGGPQAPADAGASDETAGDQEARP